jgi:hypothetical protein
MSVVFHGIRATARCHEQDGKGLSLKKQAVPAVYGRPDEAPCDPAMVIASFASGATAGPDADHRRDRPEPGPGRQAEA